MIRSASHAVLLTRTGPAEYHAFRTGTTRNDEDREAVILTDRSDRHAPAQPRIRCGPGAGMFRANHGRRVSPATATTHRNRTMEACTATDTPMSRHRDNA